jgi:hypothetical protein
MADAYASAVGTTVLQITEIPQRPEAFDGALFLLNPKVDEEDIRRAFERFGKILYCTFETYMVTLKFSSHDDALEVRRAGDWLELCESLDTLYNDRSYDGRLGDDEGRGW